MGTTTIDIIRDFVNGFNSGFGDVVDQTENIIVALVGRIFDVLPDSSALPPQFYDAWSVVMSRIGFIDNLFSVNLLFYGITSIIAFELTILTFRFAMWVIKLIRG